MFGTGCAIPLRNRIERVVDRGKQEAPRVPFDEASAACFRFREIAVCDQDLDREGFPLFGEQAFRITTLVRRDGSERRLIFSAPERCAGFVEQSLLEGEARRFGSAHGTRIGKGARGGTI